MKKYNFNLRNLLTAAALLAAVAAYAQTEQEPNDWANHQRYAQANAALAAAPKVVFMGNSITDYWPTRSAAFWEAHPEFCGRGISGQTSTQMLCRFREDVLDLNPEVVVILSGTNDVARNQGYVPTKYIAGNVRSMVELARLHGLKVAVCSVTPSSGFGWRPEVAPAEMIVELNGMLKAYVDGLGDENVRWVDYHSALVDPATGGMNPAYSPDNCHPNADGYKVMESILMDRIGDWVTAR